MALCIAMFLCGLATLRHNLEAEFARAESAIKEKKALVLDENLSPKELEDFLVNRRIIQDQAEAEYVALHIVKGRPNGGYEFLEELTATKHRVATDTVAVYGPPTLRARAERMIEEVGADANYRAAADTTASRVSFGGEVEKAPIEVRIEANDEYPVATSGVLVRLTRWSLDDRNQVETEILGYARTDSEGKAVFSVPVGGSYSVLPILPGATYGAERGTSGSGMLEAKGLTGKDAPEFKARESKMALMSKTALDYAKKHGLLLVRTPDDFRKGCRKMAVVYVLGWLGVALLLNTRRRRYDYIILVPLMALTGLSFLILAGLQNPLTDTPYAVKSLFHFIIGLAAFCGISMWNYYANLVRPAGKSGRTFMDAAGLGCLLLCVILVVWVSVKGFGPGGSDARVNLYAPGIGTFQPSEICKFLFVGFMAYFLTNVRNRLPRAAGKQREAIKLRLRYSAVMLLIIALTLGVYVLRLKDMGPAMVLLITFIILYSIVRGDTKAMIGWSLAFGVLALIARYAGGSRNEYLFALVVWLGLWLFAGPKLSKTRDLSESALMMVVVIMAYTIGGTLLEPLSPALAERLSGRVEMCWGGVWDNSVPNGDQIVRGLWALASGGHAGMGLGNTMPGMIPAGHTDMILAATGEMTGLTGILLVCVSILALVYAGFVVASRILGFGRYLTLGITVVTLVQFLLVGLGSLGLIPLSGVAVPLMSQGGVSLIITLAAYGFVMSTSGYEKEYAMDVKATNREARGNMLAIRLCGLTGVVLLFGAAAYE
ncbi:MAG: FtsW/RodA/SpoVE family cell cycle protein, partial [Muribaculaceae bacterium]|nr:FtsW/RodA/SpoVE family cell cycle protein [Muribaculaceae bacterium]